MRPSAVDRLWRSVERTSGCWLWTRGVGKNGYGTISVNGRNVYVHRFAYEVQTGEIVPPDREVCHTCDTPRCVRREHLFLGTHLVNMQDAATKSRLSGPRLGARGARARCLRGHALTDDNVHVNPNGQRACRTCRLVWIEKQNARAREATRRKQREREARVAS